MDEQENHLNSSKLCSYLLTADLSLQWDEVAALSFHAQDCDIKWRSENRPLSDPQMQHLLF